MDRLGTNFHETFALNRPALASILKLAVERGGEINQKMPEEAIFMRDVEDFFELKDH